MQSIDHDNVTAVQLDQLTDALLALPASPATNTLLSVVDQLRIGNVAFFTDLDELTPNQAAPLLGVSRPTVCRMVDSGELPARIVGKRDRRIPMSAIRRHLDRQRRTERSADAA